MVVAILATIRVTSPTEMFQFSLAVVRSSLARGSILVAKDGSVTTNSPPYLAIEMQRVKVLLRC